MYIKHTVLCRHVCLFPQNNMRQAEDILIKFIFPIKFLKLDL